MGWREQDTFIFRVEGTGALPAQDIVATAMDVLIAKLRNLQVLSHTCRTCRPCLQQRMHRLTAGLLGRAAAHKANKHACWRYGAAMPHDQGLHRSS